MRLMIGSLLAVVLALCVPAAAQATGVIGISADGTALTYRSDDPNDVDQFAVIDLGDRIRFTRFNAAGIGADPPCDFVGDKNDTVDCLKGSVTSLVLDLGEQNDIAVVAPSVTLNVVFHGGPGNDALFGGGGLDFFDGGAGDDNIVSRDTRGELVSCGAGHDTAVTDDADTRDSCEEIEGDADGDGVRRPGDCDDTKAGIHPGAPDVPDNGVDEDCNGVDAINLDKDGDGTPLPQDCDDTDATIRPTAREVIGNEVDENCDGRTAPFPPLAGAVLSSWSGAGDRTRNLTLVARGFGPGTSIRLKCSGSSTCPQGAIRRTVRDRRRPVNLHLLLGRRAFPKKARIELSITRETRVGRVLRYRMGTPGLPDVQFLCRPPGQRAGPC
jgi:hypothetical protein